jgi:hypothetical protein
LDGRILVIVDNLSQSVLGIWLSVAQQITGRKAAECEEFRIWFVQEKLSQRNRLESEEIRSPKNKEKN